MMELWIFTHQWLLDPICLGSFPDCAGTPLEALVKTLTKAQQGIIHTVPDMLGFNVYNGYAVRAAEKGLEFVPKYPG